MATLPLTLIPVYYDLMSVIEREAAVTLHHSLFCHLAINYNKVT